MAKAEAKTYFQINYRDPKDGQSISIKAKSIKDSSLGLSFVAISDFIFDTNSIVVNPEEEARKAEFEKIKTLHLSIYSILSVTEMGENPVALSFKNDKSNLLVLNQGQPGQPSN